MAGLIAMTSVFIVVGIEMFFATRGAGHIHGSEYDTLGTELGHTRHISREENGNRPSLTLRRFSQAPLGQTAVPETTNLGTVGNSQQVWNKVGSDLEIASPLPPDVDTASPLPSSDMGDDSDLDLDAEELGPERDDDHADLLHSRHIHHTSTSTHIKPTSTDPANDRATERKLLLQCLLLEAGILFHSVFIGIAVSVSTGPPFVVLLIAISFHQTFEGLALGSRIAAIPTLSPTSPKPWLMALAYGTTTPIGQAIGLGVHGLYDPQSQTGLLMVGFMNAISSGLLLFAGLVELLAEDFLSDQSYTTLKGKRRLEACAAVVAGAFLMALVGAWA
jgi:solute carrier family 39 (zinc transporter), member 1/2/3